MHAILVCLIKHGCSPKTCVFLFVKVAYDDEQACYVWTEVVKTILGEEIVRGNEIRATQCK